MAARKEVFISATSADLGSYRQVVKEALLTLGAHPIEERNFPTDYRELQDLLARRLDPCDAVIHLVGFFYGGEPEQNPNIPRRSWTQWEYYRATECEHQKPVYRFLAREDCAFDAQPEEDAEKRRLQREHWERLRIPGGPIYYEFSTPQELQERILSIEEFRDTGRIPISHNLPFPPNPLFTGRDAELEALRQGLQRRRTIAVTRTVAVHGLGGVGKTQLVVQYAWNHLQEFDAVLWAKADSPEALEASLAGLVTVLRLPEAKEREQAVQSEAVLGWLGDHDRWLLITDNADTEAAVRAVQERLRPSLPGAVLITSRLSRWPINMPQLPLDLFSAEQAARYLQARVTERQHQAGDEAHARKLAEELGYLPLALEQAGSFIVEVKWTFGRYQAAFHEARPELLNYETEGATNYPASIAKTWSITLEQLGPLARSLLRMVAWFAPEVIPREMFSADKKLLSEDLNEQATAVTDLAIEKALAELERFSLVRLTSQTVSVHRLLQAIEQDSLSGEEQHWLDLAARLFIAFAPGYADDARTWDLWLLLEPHAEALLGNTKRLFIATPPVGLIAHRLGRFLLLRGAYARAEAVFGSALAIREKALGPEHLDVARSLNMLLSLYHDQGQYVKAQPFGERALAIYEKALGPEHPDVATSLSLLALLYENEGQYRKAEALYQRALAIFEKDVLAKEKALGPEHPDMASYLNNLAALYYNLRQYGKAEPVFERALAISEKALGPEHLDVARSLNNLAALYINQGRYGKTETLYERTLAIYEKMLGPEHPDVAAFLENYALLLGTGMDRPDEAAKLQSRAEAIRTKHA